jgi:hypothetical protein
MKKNIHLYIFVAVPFNLQTVEIQLKNNCILDKLNLPAGFSPLT